MSKLKLTLGYFNSGYNHANLLVLKKRCEWRSIELEIVDLEEEGTSALVADFIVIQGENDIFNDNTLETFHHLKSQLKMAYDNKVAILAAGLGYQFIGNYYMNANGEKYDGIDLVSLRTIVEREQSNENIVAVSEEFGRVVGKSNKKSKIYHKNKALGTVTNGTGNNGEDKTEGIFIENLIGTTIDEVFLPKNPTIADFMIKKALDKKYGRPIIKSLNDGIEERANRKSWENALK